MDKFKLENLGSGITAVISKEHGFGTDALLLADFAAVKESNRCCDMGSGCGIIPLPGRSSWQICATTVISAG